MGEQRPGTRGAADGTGTRGAPDDTGPSAVDRLVAQARARLDRVAPEDLAAEQAAGALVVDMRPVEQRERDGALPGAVVVDRNVLEWRLDPTCPHRLDVVTGPDQRIVLVCHEGYGSSLAAATLRDLGLRRATDLVGGFRQWRTLQGAGDPAAPDAADEGPAAVAAGGADG